MKREMKKKKVSQKYVSINKVEVLRKSYSNVKLINFTDNSNIYVHYFVLKANN
jgi:hypothetical protein